MKGYKGTDKELKCRDFQFEIGKDYEENEAILCEKGFHFCENPMDVLGYYSPDNSRYHEVDAEDVSTEIKGESKRVSKKIKLKAEIGLSGLIKAGVQFCFSNVKWNKDITGNCSGASATGNYSGASATGDFSGASATGNCSGASATGSCSGASAGKGSVALATGMLSRAKGEKGAFIVLTECEEIKGDYFIKDVKAAKVDGRVLKENTWYFLRDGEFTEANESDYQ